MQRQNDDQRKKRAVFVLCRLGGIRISVDLGKLLRYRIKRSKGVATYLDAPEISRLASSDHIVLVVRNDGIHRCIASAVRLQLQALLIG